ncbi:MAG: hypothetical protein IJ084_04815, partial [Prevotella sp.]|nr:hypothetical protein [Prevotella sp.]
MNSKIRHPFSGINNLTFEALWESTPVRPRHLGKLLLNVLKLAFVNMVHKVIVQKRAYTQFQSICDYLVETFGESVA